MWLSCDEADANPLRFADLFLVLDTAEEVAKQAPSIPEQGRPFYEFLTLLDRAAIFAARGHVRDALATIATARHVLTVPAPALTARADELEAQIRLALGDLRSPAELAAGLPGARRELLLARIALASKIITLCGLTCGRSVT